MRFRPSPPVYSKHERNRIGCSIPPPRGSAEEGKMSGLIHRISSHRRFGAALRAGVVAAGLALVAGVPVAAQAHDWDRGRGGEWRDHGWRDHGWHHRPYWNQGYYAPRYYAPAPRYYAPGYYAPGYYAPSYYAPAPALSFTIPIR